MVGLCCLYFPDPLNKTTTEIAVSLLPAARGKGIGKVAPRKLLEHVLDVLGVHRVLASIICPVRPDQSSAEKKRVVFEAKRLCCVFERCRLTFEGISRRAMKSNYGTIQDIDGGRYRCDMTYIGCPC